MVSARVVGLEGCQLPVASGQWLTRSREDSAPGEFREQSSGGPSTSANWQLATGNWHQ
jgi:hypothetical protein